VFSEKGGVGWIFSEERCVSEERLRGEMFLEKCDG
jgi:hypothetical protein